MSDKAIVLFLSIVILGLCFFIILSKSQLSRNNSCAIPYQFVVGRTGKYCYVENQKPKNLTVLAKFDTLESCEEFVKNALYYDR